MIIDESIIKFIQNQKCASISCLNSKNKPYAFTCFYAFNSEDALLYFKSSKEADHYKWIKKKPFVSGTILPDTLNTLFIQGIQFDGELLDESHPQSKGNSLFYYKNNPLGIAIPGEILTLRIYKIKFTDFGNGIWKKLIWNRPDEI